MKKVLFTLLCVASSLAMADWLQLGDNEQAIVKVESTSIKRNPKSMKAWVLYDLKKPRQLFDGDRDYNSAIVLYEYDCTENKARFLEKNIYSEKNGRGDKFLFSDKPEYWLSIAPNTLNYKVFKYVCRVS
jgi:hypothetical protein